MTKSEYMQKLQEKLDSFSKELQEDILEDYKQHFAEGELLGKTDEEIIEELGNIEDMIRELSESELKEDMGHKLSGIDGLGQSLIQMTKAFSGIDVSEKLGEAVEKLSELNIENVAEELSATGAAEDGSVGAERHRQEGSRQEAGEQEAGEQEAEGQEGTEQEGTWQEGTEQEEIGQKAGQEEAGQEKETQEGIGVNGGIYYSYSGKYEKIALEGEEADIYLMPSPDDKVYVEYINRVRNGQELYEYCQHEENGVFYAGIKKKKKGQGGRTGVEGDGKSWRVMLFGKTVISYRNMGDSMNGEALALCVSVPKGVPELLVNVSSGDIRVDDLVQERVQLASSSGDVNVQKAVTDTMKIHSSSGDINVVSSKCCRRFEASASSGDVNVRDVVLKEGKAVTFPVNEQEAGGRREMDVHSSSGDVNIQNVTADKVSAKSSSGDVNIQNVTADKVSAKSSSGDVNVKNVTAEEVRAGSSNGDVGISNVDCSGDLLAESASGDLKIGVVKAERLNVKTSEGDLAISSADFSSGDVETSRGDMALANMRFTTGDFLTSSGDMAVSGLQFDSGEFIAKQGDIAVSKTSFQTASFTAESGDIAGYDLNGEFGGFNAAKGDIVLQDQDKNSCRGYQCITGSGDISIEASAEVYECRARSGDISVRASGTPRKLKAESSSGDVSVNAAGTPESVELQSDIGDVHVRLEETAGMEVDIGTSWGDAYIKWNGQKKNVQKGCHTYGNGACKVKAFSGKGDVVVSGSSE